MTNLCAHGHGRIRRSILTYIRIPVARLAVDDSQASGEHLLITEVPFIRPDQNKKCTARPNISGEQLHLCTQAIFLASR